MKDGARVMLDFFLSNEESATILEENELREEQGVNLRAIPKPKEKL